MSNPLRRIITSIALMLFVIATIFVFPAWFFCIVVSTLIGFGLYEFFAMVTKKGIFVYRYFGTIMGIILPIIIYLNYGGLAPDMEPFLLVIISFFVFVLQFVRRDNSQALTAISITLLGILYISWFFSFMIKIRHLPDGVYLVSFLLLVTKMGDIGAYVVGRFFGKHNLIPRISPNKTVEGTVGGFAVSMVTAFIVRGFLPNSSFVDLVILGVLLGVLSQIGDLSESLIKRDCQVKDAATYLPGLGGVLDIIDSLLFTTPIFYFYVRMFL
ncbi:MAG: phosphatidate cytidylyltransferase [Candidatus Omnitrophica bacterium]|nr:phosphatidate cytidylyltransferase [Candidatus Omnitrophota bacterium]